MSTELAQLAVIRLPEACLDPVEPSDQPGAVVLDLRRKRPLPSSPSTAYRVDGALALKEPLAAREPLEVAPLKATPLEPVRTTPEATRTAVIVARALLEVLAGWRPASQLSRWTSYALQQDLERRAPRRPTGTPLQLRRVRISEQTAGIAEVCALADDPVHQRVRVLALRLEDRQGTWILTRLQAG
jgi:hypothetical protein